MMTDVEIKVEEVAHCLYCQKPGTQLYAGLRDRLFGAPGVWGFLQCPECQLVWLNPRPVPEDLGKVYVTYYTHNTKDNLSGLAALRNRTRLALYSAVSGYSVLAKGWGWRQFGRALSLVPTLKERARLGLMCLDSGKKGRLLDVGCGSGYFLGIMRDAGWDVLGVDKDAAAADVARELYGVRVAVGTLQEAKLPAQSFDAVTLSHVIEHVVDPIGLLTECARVLKPGGKLVVLTPNVKSLAHEIFRDSWRGLEPPRHLHLFSMDTLQAAAERAKLQVESVSTSARSAGWVGMASCSIKDKGTFSDSDASWRLRLGGVFFHLREEVSRCASKGIGEELVLVGSRKV